jgi:A/G-specific adenine glycosylase
MKYERDTAFRRTVWAHYKKHGRHTLPWRATRDPYRILVSEVMLQQTQVERVIPFYTDFLKKFPSARALARAPLAEVLRAWQGLGYNRRARLLRETARAVTDDHGGRFPTSVEALEKLPGIGPYTARALAAFAHNRGSVFIETNIRTAVMHHYFPESAR